MGEMIYQPDNGLVQVFDYEKVVEYYKVNNSFWGEAHHKLRADTILKELHVDIYSSTTKQDFARVTINGEEYVKKT